MLGGPPLQSSKDPVDSARSGRRPNPPNKTNLPSPTTPTALSRGPEPGTQASIVIERPIHAPPAGVSVVSGDVRPRPTCRKDLATELVRSETTDGGHVRP